MDTHRLTGTLVASVWLVWAVGASAQGPVPTVAQRSVPAIVAPLEPQSVPVITNARRPVASLPTVDLQQPAPVLQGQRVTPRPMETTATQGFSVILVLGDLQGSGASETLPKAAQKALADMRDFLPYRSYRMLDAEWILSSGQAESRLHGLDNAEYDLRLSASSFNAEGGKNLRVTFSLSEAGGGLYTVSGSGVGAASASGGRGTAPAEVAEREGGELAALQRERSAVTAELSTLRSRLGAQHPDVIRVEAKLAGINRQISELSATRARTYVRSNRTVINTSFAMDVGETVVVGTSRLRGGDKALIVLLTAVPRGGTGAR